MLKEFLDLWATVLHPVAGFGTSMKKGPSLGGVLRRMLWLRLPVALVDCVLIYWNARMLLHSARTLDGQVGTLLRRHLPPEISMDELGAALKAIPDLPPFLSLLPWLVLTAFLGLIGAWLHHAVWDHTCLLMLGGLREKRGFKVSLIAEAEALSVGTFGAILGLLASLPLVGCLFGTLSALAGIWFWGLRGVALATFHGCPVWKGVVATVLHALLMLLFVLGVAAMMFFLVVSILGGG